MSEQENPDGLERRVCPIHDEVYISTCFGCVADEHRSELAMYDQAHSDNTASPDE